MSVRCEACGADNPEAFRLCGTCGSTLGERCPACSAPVVRGFRFCGSCGLALDAAEARTGTGVGVLGEPVSSRVGEIPRSAAERRLVSILFADLVSFTTLAEGRDPEEVQDLQGRYFETCRAIIARYGGAVNKFIGDAVMAMWGAPVAHEDGAERAVRAGRALAAAVAAVGEQVGLPRLAARAGVVSGEAAITVGAVGQGMVAGDVVNTAARLQSAARPGTVLVDEATYRTTRGSIAFERAGDRTLRGKRLPVPAWEARQVVALRRGKERSVLPEGPLVGRDGAVAIVKDLLETVREERTPRLASIIGQAGIGKSRIGWELEKYVDGIVEKIAWHQARSPAYGEGLAFWALAEMVRFRAGIAEGDPPSVARKRLTDCLATYVPNEVERRWIAPHLSGLVGLGPVPDGGREEAFAAWRSFFERVADTGTTVLVFDDLHWADAGLLDFIEYFAQTASGRPILVATLARPALLERRPDWAAGLRGAVVVQLDPLPRGAMAELLDGLAPGLPDAVAGRVLDRAEGIPLYAVETLRMLVDRGELEVVDGAYRVRGSLDRLAIPETLQALVAARLDDLDPEDRSLIRDAAVLGQAFRPAALAAIGGSTVEAIEPNLDRLVQRALLVEETDERDPARGSYRFLEWLVREVAYGTLSLRDRRERHLAAARYLEELGDPDQIAAVAGHMLAAHRSSPPGRQDRALALDAVAALRAAADRAVALHSPEQAIGFIEGALSITDDEAERAQLWEQAAIAAQAAAHLKEAAAYARQALDWHTAHGDRSAVARTTVRLGAILAFGYEAEASIAVVKGAIEELAGDPALRDDPWLAELYAGMARSYLLAGRIGEAVDWSDRALADAERLGLQPVVAGALASKGAAFLEEGRTTEGIGLLRTSLAMAEQHGLIVPALRARNSLAVGLLADDPRAALDTAAVGLEVARRFGFRDLAIRLASSWAEAALDVGDWDAILDLVAELHRADLPVTDRVDFESTAALVRAWRGDPAADETFRALDELGAAIEPDLAVASLRCRQAAAALALGRPVEALGHAESATTRFRPSGFRTALLWGLVPAARAALWAGDDARVGEAIAEVERSGLGGRYITAILATLRAGLDARRGAVDAAIERYAAAAGLWRGLDVPLQLALCDLEAARYLPPGSPEAAAARDEARAILERLGASSLIERLESGTASAGQAATAGAASSVGATSAASG